MQIQIRFIRMGIIGISPAIALDDTEVSYTKVSSSAIYIDMTDSTDELKYKIGRINKIVCATKKSVGNGS